MSETGNNPFLLNPHTMADIGPTAALAAAQARAITAPLPMLKMNELKHYVCLIKNHQMHRTDGAVIHFLAGHHATDMYHTANYLDNEIAHGNQFVRAATDEEIRIYNMRRDPTGTIRSELAPQMEAEIRNRLELELQMVMAAKMDDIGVTLTDEQKAQLAELFAYRREDAATVQVPVDSDAAKIAQTDALSRLRATTTGVKTGTGTVFIPSSAPNALGGISGTDKMANAADSNSDKGK